MKTPIILLTLIVWQSGGEIADSEDSTARRPALAGKVSDPDGNPLAGIRVDIATAAPKAGPDIFCPSNYRDCAKSARTDEAGQFQLTKLDPTLKFRLLIAAAGRKSVQTKLLDPQDGLVEITLPPAPAKVDPGRVVSGIVTLDTRPVAGALVEVKGGIKPAPERLWIRAEGTAPAVTDENGRFALVLTQDMLEVYLDVTGYGFCGTQLTAVPGGPVIRAEVDRGARVTGRVMRSGQPVAGLSLAVVQTERNAWNGIFVRAIGDVTNDEGRFDFRYLPPGQKYCIYSVAGNTKRADSGVILTTKTFMATAEEARDLGMLEAAEPVSIRGRVQRVDGKPLPKNLKLSFDRQPAWDLISIPVKDDGSFEAKGLPPETYAIRLSDRSLVVVPDNFKYQTLGASSFGVYASETIDNLVIPVRGE